MATCACGCGRETPIATRNWHTLGIVKGEPRKYLAGHSGQHRPLEQRFWEKVDKTSECWLWTGSRDHRGYGRIQRGGRGEGHIKAHRLSYELRHGPLPEGAFVCHRCDNPPCVNPDHLFVGTPKDNAQDMARKGRRRGSYPPAFPDPQVLFDFLDAGGTQRGAAAHFGVAHVTVHRTLKRHGRTRATR